MNYISKEDSDKLFCEFADRKDGSPKDGYPEGKEWKQFWLMSRHGFFKALNASVTRFGIKMEDMDLDEATKRKIIKELYKNMNSEEYEDECNHEFKYVITLDVFDLNGYTGESEVAGICIKCGKKIVYNNNS